MEGLRLIAVDGPAGSGKSTVARAVARELGLEYLDTGAMYRGIAHAALLAEIDPADVTTVVAMAERTSIVVADRVEIDGKDATAEIRSPEVTVAVTAVAANPGVRRLMVERQRDWAVERGGGVVEGRDIGTVVFPDAPLKVFLTADPAERSRRRAAEAGESLAVDIARRDLADSTRPHSPLAVAGDAVVLDTTDHEVEEVVQRILELADQRGLRR